RLYVAHKNWKVGEAVSQGFLLCWIGGDLTKSIGGYLTNQLPIQIFAAILHMSMDTIMLSQFAYYKLKNQKKKMMFQPQLFKDSITRDKIKSKVNGGDPSAPAEGSIMQVPEGDGEEEGIPSLYGMGAVLQVSIGDPGQLQFLKPGQDWPQF
ncbi:PREDICTED: LOW QUALITY PROTEIN: putative uncharacterized protein C3orf55 homolog, partial [Galeopterus variegatus]|uniref:Uncharacterized protein n=1 Tax=Galeopterus variegatus TaxID=482537 RepID=A0ABM0R215_GALVR